MRIDHILPVALVVLMASASLVSLVSRQYFDSLYWIAGAVLNLAVILK